MLLKERLLWHCWNFIEEKENSFKKTRASLQESLNSETKSSAGDKHETGRAMVQLEQEKLGKQLFELEKMKQTLQKAQSIQKSKKASLGSLVKTSNNQYFLAISAGVFKASEETVYCISVASPMGQVLLGKQEGDSFSFNGMNLKVMKVI